MPHANALANKISFDMWKLILVNDKWKKKSNKQSEIVAYVKSDSSLLMSEHCEPKESQWLDK